MYFFRTTTTFGYQHDRKKFRNLSKLPELQQLIHKPSLFSLNLNFYMVTKAKIREKLSETSYLQ